MTVLRENLPEKALAVLLALFMWAAARDLQNPEQVKRKLDLEWRGLPDTLVAVRGPEQVHFILRGTREEIRQVTPRSLSPYVDLSDAGPGKRSFEIFYRLSGSVDLQHIEVVPPRAEFEFDRLVKKRFEVRTELQGRLPEQFRMVHHTSTPTHVWVSGRERLVSLVAAAVVQVDIRDPEGTLKKAPVQLLSETGRPVRGLKPRPEQVQVSLDFLEQAGQVEVAIRPRTRGRVAPGADLETIRLSPETVSLTGRVDLLRELIEVKTEEIDLTGLKDTTERTVRLVVPPGLRVSGSASTVATIVVRPVRPVRPQRDPDDTATGAKGTGKASAKSTGKGVSEEPPEGEQDDASPPSGGGGE